MRPRVAVLVSLSLLSLVACQKESSQKPYWDMKRAFGDAIVKMAGFVPYVDDQGIGVRPVYVDYVTDHARNQIAQAAHDALEAFDRKKPEKIDGVTKTVADGLTVIASTCQAKTAVQRTGKAPASATKCKDALLALDGELARLAGEAKKLDLPDDVVARLTVPPPVPPGASDVGSMKQVLAKGPAETAWQTLRDDPKASLDALKRAAFDTEKEAEGLAKDAPTSVQELFEARVIFSKGRQPLVVQASNMAALDCDSLKKLKPDEACPGKDACKALRELEKSHELPAAYRPRIEGFAKGCPELPPEPAPSVSAAAAALSAAAPSAAPRASASVPVPVPVPVPPAPRPSHP